MSARRVPLGELCEMDRRGIQPDDPLTAELPFVGVENVVGGTGLLNFDTDSRIGGQKSTAFRFDRRHVLYGKLRPYLNKVAIPDFAGRCSTELVPLLPRNGVDRDFLAHLLRRKETVEFVLASVTGSRMPRTDMKGLMSMPVLLPTLGEQRRIAGILNRAARIERLRARTADHFREFVPALFIKMFGDPKQYPKKWEIKQLGDLFHVRGGKRLPKGSRYADHRTPYRYIRATDILAGEIKDTDARYISQDIHTRISRYVVGRSDTLLTIAGKIGVAAPVSEELAGANLTENAARLTPIINGRANNVFLSTQLNSEFVQTQIRMRTGRVTIGKLAIERIKTMEVFIPPISLQDLYAELIGNVRVIFVASESSVKTASALAKSLSTRLVPDNS